MQVPIQMENMALGIALNLAGIAPWQNKYFAFVVYDEALLKTLGFATIKEAMAAGKCGHLVCNFDNSEWDMVEMLKHVWDEERRKIGEDFEAVKSGKEPRGTKLSEGVTQADIVKITARVLAARKQMVNDWAELPIFAHIKNGIPEVSEGDRGELLITHPGYMMVSIRASQKILAHLGLAALPEPIVDGGEEEEE